MKNSNNTIGNRTRDLPACSAVNECPLFMYYTHVDTETVVMECLQNLLSSNLLSKNIQIKIYRTIILSVVLYGFETCSLTLREERRLRVFENKVLRKILGPRRDKVMGK